MKNPNPSDCNEDAMNLPAGRQETAAGYNKIVKSSIISGIRYIFGRG
jgi:hypothetical protein